MTSSPPFLQSPMLSAQSPHHESSSNPLLPPSRRASTQRPRSLSLPFANPLTRRQSPPHPHRPTARPSRLPQLSEMFRHSTHGVRNPLTSPTTMGHSYLMDSVDCSSKHLPFLIRMQRQTRRCRRAAKDLLLQFYVQWRLMFPLMLLVCGMISMMVLFQKVDWYRSVRRHYRTIDLAFMVSTTALQTAPICAEVAYSSMSAGAAEGVLDDLTNEIMKKWPDVRDEYMVYVHEAKTYLKAGECQLAILSLNALFSHITSTLDGDSSLQHSSDFAYTWGLGLSKLRRENLARLTEDAPVTSRRALEAANANMLCSPVVQQFVSRMTDAALDMSAFSCDEVVVQTLMNHTPVRLPNFSTKDIAIHEVFLATHWADEMGKAFDPYYQLSTFILLGVAMLFAAVGTYTLLRISYMESHFHRTSNIIQRDFIVAHERKGVQLQPDTLRMLDYYCWKVGSLEAPDLEELARILADPAGLAQRTTLHATLRRDPSISVPFPNTSAGTFGREMSMASSAGMALLSATVDAVPSLESPANGGDDQLHPLMQQVSERQTQLRACARELYELGGATQLQLYMHHTAHPIALLRPFVPDHMMGVASFQLPDIVGLGPSVTAKHASSVLQEGLVAGQPAALLFVSFRPFNRPDAVGTAAQLYMRRADEAAAEFYDEEEGGCCCGGGGGTTDNSNNNKRTSFTPAGEGSDAATTEVVAVSEDSGSSAGGVKALNISAYGRLHGRLIDDARLKSALRIDPDKKNPLLPQLPKTSTKATTATEDRSTEAEKKDEDEVLHYPLSPLAASLNFVLEMVWKWCEVYGGEVVQMSSDGVLVQYAMEANGCKVDFKGVLAASSSLQSGEEVQDENAHHHKTVDVTVHGKTYQLCAEERAARTALSIHASLEEFLDYSENHLVPPELLRCPMVVLYDEGCVAGRLRFHVSKHYSLLSRQIPLMFPLEQVWEEYGATVIITQAVQSRLEGMCLSRPIHYVDVEDLNCYYVPRSGAETERLQRRCAEEANDSIFCASGTVYDLHGIRDLDAASQAYDIFVDEEARTRARRDHWHLVWVSYQDVLQRTGRSQLRRMCKAAEEESRRDSFSKPGGSGSASSSRRSSTSGSPRHSEMDLEERKAAIINSRSLLAAAEQCYRELLSFEAVYTVKPTEAYSVEKVREELVMLMEVLKKPGEIGAEAAEPST